MLKKRLTTSQLFHSVLNFERCFSSFNMPFYELKIYSINILAQHSLDCIMLLHTTDVICTLRYHGTEQTNLKRHTQLTKTLVFLGWWWWYTTLRVVLPAEVKRSLLLAFRASCSCQSFCSLPGRQGGSRLIFLYLKAASGCQLPLWDTVVAILMPL